MDALVGEAAERLSVGREPWPPSGAVPPKPRCRADRPAQPRRRAAPPMPAAPPPGPAHAATPPSWRRAKPPRSAATLDELRAILDRFDGCSLKGSASRLVFADGTPRRAADVRRRGAGRARRTCRACRSSAAPGNCSTACWRRSGSTAARSISPTSCRGGRRATARRRRTRRRSACRSSSARSSSPIPTCW